jgi:hypothetical protein
MDAPFWQRDADCGMDERRGRKQQKRGAHTKSWRMAKCRRAEQNLQQNISSQFTFPA